MEIYGIDVSHYQGNIDWETVAKTGIDFAFVKAGGSEDGIYTESMFEKNYAGAKAAGLNVGAYYFPGSNFTSEEAGIADARRFLDIIAGKTFEMPVALDLEGTKPEDKDGATIATIAFCKIMEAAGYYAMIYGGDIFSFNDRLNLGELDEFDKWVARYGSEPQYVKEYGIWQYSSTDYIDGITENTVDKDVAYKNYPEIIKNAGLNGFSSDTVDEPENETPDEPAIEEPEESSDEPVTYVIQSGDTLSEIAARYNTTVDELVELNGIDNPDLIYPGNEIIVKAGSSRDDDCDVVYQVRPGDTLSEIAARYNTTVGRLVEVNGIDNPDLIYPDTILKIK